MAGQKAYDFKQGATLVGLAVLVCAANWLSVYYLKYPFLYCWGTPVVWPVYLAFGNILNVVAICVFAYQAFRYNIKGMIAAAVAVVLVMGIPIYAVTLFKLGGSCGV
ncbi:hypothetical protein [Mesorhizobium sp. B2-3-10]|uniref:hypothetical protein n=1 Tax=Mesorhizobium sp. B2-3-10 TaxID=2589954 RepID=UPI00112919D7|nr:hypothetical protein [Mesorhizobium sp. B2-3-10]TPL98338.1 hypothetical protein FJ943_15655 [Mesorhizobium sp. B2-3-10]